MPRRTRILPRFAALSPLERLAVVVPVLVVVTLAGTSLGLAEVLGVGTPRLTSSSGPVTVPVTTCTLTAVADTYADENATGTNSGTATTFNVTSRTGRARRAFVRFNLTTCAIPGVADVRTASLRLYMSTAPTATRTYDVHRATAAWVETTLTWTAQPAVAGAATASVATGTTANVTLQWDVLTDVDAFVAGTTTNQGWRVMDRTEIGGTTFQSTFRSREFGTAAQRPQLVITYYP